MLADQVWQEAFGAPKTHPERPLRHLQTGLPQQIQREPSRRIYQGSLDGSLASRTATYPSVCEAPFSF